MLNAAPLVVGGEEITNGLNSHADPISQRSWKSPHEGHNEDRHGLDQKLTHPQLHAAPPAQIPAQRSRRERARDEELEEDQRTCQRQRP